jgi:hypothetical protein
MGFFEKLLDRWPISLAQNLSNKDSSFRGMPSNRF